MKRESSNKELYEIFHDYDSFDSFVKESSPLSFVKLDYNYVNKMTLFKVRESLDIKAVEEVLLKIENALPAIKRIFQKPIIHLTEKDEIVPVEAVKRINNDTLVHATFHSEMWDDITKEGIKPKKLLTKIYEDNYSIYENIVFKKCIDECLFYLRKNLYELSNMIYATKVMEFNILERVNHIDYFLALGKLHTGYIRNFDQYYDNTKNLIDRLNSCYNNIVQRLKRPVYSKNKNYHGKFILRSTNILAMQKDYHKVYLLLKYFNKIEPEAPDITTMDRIKFEDSYFKYSTILTIFSASHFNFKLPPDEMLDLNNLNNTFEYKGWSLNIRQNISLRNEIVLEFFKDKKYTILIRPYTLADDLNDDHTEVSDEYDEIIYFYPFNNPKNSTFISISDIESFRRVQQIIQRGMIYSEDNKTTCPFCGDTLDYIKKEDYYLCHSCSTIIAKNKCPECGYEYYYTTMNNLHINKAKKNYLHMLDNSSNMYYRNITDITDKCEIICPKCHKADKKEE